MGWAREGGESTLGELRFGSNTQKYYQEQVEFPFFNYYLKDKGEMKLAEAVVFETGSNQWQSYDHWPPQEAVERNLYLQADGKLSFDRPGGRGGRANDEFVSDPDNPAPFSAEKRNTQGHTWMVEDQRFAAGREDVLVYQSEVLTEDIIVAGPIIADLFVSTTGTDADWVVKLIDVFPGDEPDNTTDLADEKIGGYQMLVGGEVFRGKYRNSYEKPEPFVPGEITELKYDLRDKYHCFQKGHRIMVQIQSSWFPVIDRNPQKFVDIYHASESDFQKATHKVYRSGNYVSHLKIRILH